MKVKDCTKIPLPTCKMEDTVEEVSKKLKETGSRYVLVMNEEPEGIISASDIVFKVIAEEKNPKEMKAKNIIKTPLCFVREEDDTHKAMLAVIKRGLHSCPVLDENNQNKGLVTLQELITKTK